jgi:hypothetical protein
MDIKRIRFMRELLVTNGKGKTRVVREFSYDAPSVDRLRFFGVPDDQEAQAAQLYLEWGGSRPEGWRVGSMVSPPELTASQKE